MSETQELKWITGKYTSEYQDNRYKSHDIDTLECIKKKVDHLLKDKEYYIIPLDEIYFFTLSNHDTNNTRIGIILMDIAISKYNANTDEYIKEYFEKIIIAHAEELQSHLNNLINKLKENING